jgi:hypothetical protein
VPVSDRPWYMALWGLVDATLKRWADQLQSMLRALRVVRVLLVLGILVVVASAALAVLAAGGYMDPKWFYLAYGAASVFLLVPLVALVVLVGLPLRAKSVTRLIDMGYPANARELAIRVMARKLRDESIETEELLVETAVNEAKKVFRRMEEAKRRDREGDAPQAPPPGPPP